MTSTLLLLFWTNHIVGWLDGWESGWGPTDNYAPFWPYSALSGLIDFRKAKVQDRAECCNWLLILNNNKVCTHTL